MATDKRDTTLDSNVVRNAPIVHYINRSTLSHNISRFCHCITYLYQKIPTINTVCLKNTLQSRGMPVDLCEQKSRTLQCSKFSKIQNREMCLCLKFVT